MKDIEGVGQKWPEMVVKWTIVTHRLGESVFTFQLFFSSNRFDCYSCKKPGYFFHQSNQQNLPLIIHQESKWKLQFHSLHRTNKLAGLACSSCVHSFSSTNSLYCIKVNKSKGCRVFRTFTKLSITVRTPLELTLD